MFQLHDKTRRKLATAGFILFCLLPTCAVGGWCLWRNLPWETRITAEQLERQLGWKVKLERVKHPRPGVDVYENLELIDAETARAVFRCPSIEVSRRAIADRDGKEKTTLVFSLERPEIDAASLDQIGRGIERVLQRQTAPDVNCRFSASELNLRQGKKFFGIDAFVDHSAANVLAAMQFHLPGKETAVPAVIYIDRNRTIDPPRSRFELNTGENELPCESISSALGGLGSQTRFRGELVLDYSPPDGRSTGPNGAVIGQFFDVDLKAVMRESCEHEISGLAEVVLEKPVYFTGGRLDSLNAQVKAGPGVASRSFLKACVEKLGFETSLDLGIAGDEINYRQLAFGISIDSQGLRIRGRCPFRQDGQEARGVVMIDRNLCLLSDPPSQPCSLASLIQALAPPSSSQVPATRQADRLMRRLPLPAESDVR